MGSNIKDYLNGERIVYNTFINSTVSTDNTTNRVFTSYDIFPTTLAALGVKIEGNRLGLGTNLFSNVLTIPEEIGKENFENELEKKSDYYNYNFLQGVYYELLLEDNG